MSVNGHSVDAISADVRAALANDLRRLMRHVDVNTREACAQNLCCPHCGGGLHWNMISPPPRPVRKEEIALPYIMAGEEGREQLRKMPAIVGYIHGRTSTKVWCARDCGFEVRDGYEVCP